jgi:hypothetical protein
LITGAAGAVKRDRSIGGVSPHQIEHLLEQFELIFIPHAADLGAGG